MFECFNYLFNRNSNKRIIKKILKNGWEHHSTHPDIYILKKSYIVSTTGDGKSKITVKNHTVYFKITEYSIKIYNNRSMRWIEPNKKEMAILKLDNSTVIIHGSPIISKNNFCFCY
jgi:hypothetical protein